MALAVATADDVSNEATTSAVGRFCCKSRLQPIRPLGLLLRAAALDALP
jgi:hypothetical protein